MCIHASRTQLSLKHEPGLGPRVNNRAPVFNVQVMLLMWCDVHVRMSTDFGMCASRVFDYSRDIVWYHQHGEDEEEEKWIQNHVGRVSESVDS